MSKPAPRYLHPGAWWCWALCLSTAATRTTNPVALLLLACVAAYVVVARRPSQDLYASNGLRSLGFFVRLGLAALVVRLAFDVVFGDALPGRVLVHLPSVPLPDWLTGLRVGGAVTLQGLLSASYLGLQLAVLLVAVGAANALASPRRLLRALPGALYELGVAVTVALSLAPSLVDAALRVRRARRLRGLSDHGLRSWAGVALPVMQDALERSVLLAAAMDSRGFGRRGTVSRGRRRVVAATLVVGLTATCASSYGLLVASSPGLTGLPLLIGGVALAGGAVLLGGRAVARTRYRPDPWRTPEWTAVAAGLAVLAGMVAAGRLYPGSLHPSVYPLAVPTLPWPALAGALAGLLPAWTTPAPPVHATSRQPRVVETRLAGALR